MNISFKKHFIQNLGLMALVLFLMIPQSFAAAGLCADAHMKESILRKVGISAVAPVKDLWRNLTYTEVPAMMSHPIYKKMESKMPAASAKVVNKLLYASANGFRKVYNALSSRGLGLPLPAIRTKVEIAREKNGDQLSESFNKTYFGDLNTWLSKFSLLNKVKTGAKKSYQAMLLTGTIFFSLHTMGNVAEVAQSKSVYLSAKETVSQTMPLRNDQIQILNETAPFPHTAIRIGDQIFSHGVDRLTQTQADYYLNSHRINQDGSLKGVSSADLMNNSMMNKMGKMQRSVDGIVLNLDAATVLKIRDELMAQTNKQYENITFVNSCSSMVVRVLQSQGINTTGMFLDASPGFLFSTLSLESMAGRVNKAGEPLVDGIYDVHYEGDTSDKTMRNFLIREIEGGFQLQVHTLPIRIAQRIKLNHDNPELKDLYKDDLDLTKGLESIRQSAEQDMMMIQEYDLYTLERDQLIKHKAKPEQFSALKAQYKTLFAVYIKDYRQDLQNPGISFADYHLTTFKIEFLESAISE